MFIQAIRCRFQVQDVCFPNNRAECTSDNVKTPTNADPKREECINERWKKHYSIEVSLLAGYAK